jgi:glucan phosphoethanolaminetransferase (alkaline phosphatase superfamily)
MSYFLWNYNFLMLYLFSFLNEIYKNYDINYKKCHIFVKLQFLMLYLFSFFCITLIFSSTLSLIFNLCRHFCFNFCIITLMKDVFHHCYVIIFVITFICHFCYLLFCYQFYVTIFKIIFSFTLFVLETCHNGC